MTIERRLEDFGIKPICGRYRPVESAEIEALQNITGMPLPHEYEEFIKKYGCSYFPNHRITVRSIQPPPPEVSDTDFLEFSCFFGGGDQKHGLLFHVRTFRGRMPETIIPIADDYHGNLFCLGVGGSEREKVFFWDFGNEACADDYIEAGLPVQDHFLFNNLTLVANTFSEFLSQMEVETAE